MVKSLGIKGDDKKKMLLQLSTDLLQSHQSGSENLWIVKPVSQSKGNGIHIIRSRNELNSIETEKQCWIVQKYIENPLTIEGKKLDFRIWVVVYGGSVYYFKDCYARFTGEEYDIRKLEAKRHLTNNALFKKNNMWSLNQVL